MISPSSNSSSRLIQRSIVVFPEPDGPITATVCPLGMVSDTRRSTSLEPNRFVSPRISISGAAGSGSALMDILHPFFEIAAVRGEVEADTEAGAAESDIYAGLTQDRRLTNSCASIEARPRRPDESRDFRRDPGKDDYCG